MNATQVKNGCMKMKRNVRRNMDQMKLKKRIILTMVNVPIGGCFIVRLGERNINDKDEMDGNRGNGNDRMVDSTGNNDEDRGNIFENMKRKSLRNCWCGMC